jgi:hypothetical protein
MKGKIINKFDHKYSNIQAFFKHLNSQSISTAL